MTKKKTTDKPTIAVGGKVIILRRDIKLLEGRRKPWKGTVVSIDGECIYVKPFWFKHTIELYRNEVQACS